MTRRGAAFGAALAIALFAAWVFWPGLAMYDTVAQYGQVIGGDVDDWHPPAMVRLWQLLHLVGGTTEPMLVLQLALYAVGFGLLAEALVTAGRTGAAIAVLLLAASPLLLGWQAVVLKDGQMLGGMLAAVGLVTRYRLAARPVPGWAVAVVALLLVYATLVRGNAAFATVPLAFLMLPGARLRTIPIAAATLLVLAVLPVVNHVVLQADQSGVAKSQPLFDLAGIAVRTPPSSNDHFTPAERAQIIGRHCSKAFFWDPLGEPTACAAATTRSKALSTGALFVALARAVASHPLAYGAHRLAHWNSTERWLVPAGLIGAAPPESAEPNKLGLANPSNPLVPAWQSLAAAEAATPLGWPIAWTLLAFALLPLAWPRRAEPTGGIAFALAASAVTLEASFLVVSIASDLRYHLWSMTAAALALILLSDRLPRRWLLVVGASLVALITAGLVARVSQPHAPATYRAMVDTPTG